MPVSTKRVIPVGKKPSGEMIVKPAPPEASTCEGEIYSMVEALLGQRKFYNMIEGVQGGWLSRRLASKGWGLIPVLRNDNQGALDLAESNVFSRRLGHLDLRCSIINSYGELKWVIYEKVGTRDNSADINTKRGRGPQYDQNRDKVSKL